VLLVLVAMGCQQGEASVTTHVVNDPTAIPTARPNAIANDDTFEVANVVTPLGVAAEPRVWTNDSFSLEIVPGAPAPQRAVPVTTRNTAPAPAPVVTAAPMVAAPPPAPPPVVETSSITNAAAAASDIAGRTNGVRTSRGLAPLTRDGSLDSAAAGWAAQMATSGTLQHSTIIQQLIGHPWTSAGENVGYGGSSAIVHDALVNSPSHLANIVGATYTRLGVGAAIDGTGRLWVVELFVG
jgi:uncharacterized protein YkwD